MYPHIGDQQIEQREEDDEDGEGQQLQQLIGHRGDESKLGEVGMIERREEDGRGAGDRHQEGQQQEGTEVAHDPTSPRASARCLPQAVEAILYRRDEHQHSVEEHR